MICKYLDLIHKQKKILYIHGYNTLQPSPFHWRFMDKLALSTLYEVVCQFILKHQNTIFKTHLKAIDGIYQSLLEEVDAKHIVIMGDGTGGISTKLRSTTCG